MRPVQFQYINVRTTSESLIRRGVRVYTPIEKARSLYSRAAQGIGEGGRKEKGKERSVGRDGRRGGVKG